MQQRGRGTISGGVLREAAGGDEKQTEKTDAIGERLADTEDIDEIKDAFGEFPAILDDFLDDLEGLEPPEEAEDAHNEAVEAGRDFLEEFDELMEDIEDAERHR